MSRALLAAVDRLERTGRISPPTAAHLARVARGELVSVRSEVQFALWAGVTLVAAGAGALVRQHLAQLGPLTVGGGIALAAGLCLWYVARTAPPFSWGAVASPTLAFDYVLLLAVALVGADLAWLETQLRLLGPAWAWHLLLLSLVQLGFAFRHDSRAVLTLALASFAAWRGVSLSLDLGRHSDAQADLLRLDAAAVGALFLCAGALLRRLDRKAHFEPTFGTFGLVLLLGAAVSGAYGWGNDPAVAWGGVLAAASAATTLLAWRARRSGYFALGAVAGSLGLLRLAVEADFGIGLWFLVSAGSFGVLLLILWAHRRFKEEP